MPKSKYKIKIRDYLISLVISIKRKYWHYHKRNELLAVCKNHKFFVSFSNFLINEKLVKLNFDMGAVLASSAGHMHCTVVVLR